VGLLHVRARRAEAVMRSRLGLALLFVIAFAPATARAHTQPYTFLDLHFAGDSLGGKLMAHVEDLARGLPTIVPDSLLDPGFATRHHAELAGVLAPRLDVELDGRRIEPAFDPVLETIPDRKLVVFHFHARVGSPLRVIVRGPIFAEDPQHETYLNVYAGERLAHQDLLDAGKRESDFLSS